MDGCVERADNSERSENEVQTVQSHVDVEEGEDKSVLRNFIELYESMPELWNSSLPCYMNKTKRNAGLRKLLQIYEIIKPGATIADVRRKINTLRCNYRKELKKIVTSKRSGAGADEVYVPTSWVFHALKFLPKCEQPANLSTEVNESFHDGESQSIKKEIEKKPPVTQISASTTTSSSSISVVIPPKKQRKVGPMLKQNELLTMACKYLQQGPKEPSYPHVPTIAKVWGEKLESLDQHQKLFAEKAINDILFEASMGNLHRYSVRINDDNYLQRNPSVSSFTSPSTTSSAPSPL